LLGTRTVPSLSAGESRVVSIDWNNIPESGEKVIYVQVDPGNLIHEIREDDNSAFVALKILRLPDLAIAADSISFTPSAPKEGEPVAVQVMVQNKGEQTASGVPVRWYEGGVLLSDQIISSIAGNAQGSAMFIYNTAGKSGPHSITVTVDPDNTIIEQSKANNQASRTFGVQDASLWLTEPYLSPNSDGIKESTQLFFRLKAPQTVHLVVIDERGKSVRSFSGGPLENAADGNIVWDGMDESGKVVADGSYRIEIRDPNDAVSGSLPVIVDNNRSPFTKAVGTSYLLSSNITCGLPDLFAMTWKWFPDGSGILFSIDVPSPNAPEYPTGLYTMAANGTDIVRLVPVEWTQRTDPTYDYFLRYDLSPDGEKIALIVLKYNRRQGQSELSQLWVMDRDGQGLNLIDSYDLLQQDTPINAIKWSADGGSIAYKLEKNFIDELWTVRPDGTEKSRIDGNGFIEFQNLKGLPGGRLVYSLEVYDSQGIRTESLNLSDGSGNKQTLRVLNGRLRSLLLAGDRKMILTEVDPGSNRVRLRLIDLAGNEVFVSDPLLDDSIEIAPDGERFAFITGAGAETIIQVSDLQGNAAMVETLQTAIPFALIDLKGLVWSPDSTRLGAAYGVFCSGPRLCRSVCSPDGQCSSFSLAPLRLVLVDIKTGGKKFFEPSLSPDDFTAGDFSLVKWLSDGSSILGKTSGSYYVIQSENGATFSLASGISALDNNENIVSPHEGALAYAKYLNDSSGACDGKEFFDLWTITSLLNLHADLQVTKEGSAIVLKGIAADLNFENYRLDYADTTQPALWNPVTPPSDRPVINELMTTWVPPYEGTFNVKLTVWDKGGNQAAVTRRVSWGAASSVTNIYKTFEIFSPNGDGVKDTAELHYKVLQPVHLEFYVYDDKEQVIRIYTKDHSVPAEYFIAWDGRDASGNFVPDGKYKIRLFDFAFFFTVDTTPPDVGLSIGSVDQNDDLSLYVDLRGHVVDSNLKKWTVEYGEGENPQEWQLLLSGEAAVVGLDQSGKPIFNPARDALLSRYEEKEIERLVGKR
ncbi:MAG TPA: CARDB domain-containing protein, partial [Candidatus Manganitrophaceae bacterium]|nr:CARDB domain-containing protein [Candidatus Manganitrophaceae bacterium]